MIAGRKANPWRALKTSPRSLIEQNLLHLGIRHVHFAGLLNADRHAAFDRRPRQHGIEPPFQMWKLIDVLALPFPSAHPADAGDVGDRIFAGKEVAIFEPRVHYSVESIALVGVAL